MADSRKQRNRVKNRQSGPTFLAIPHDVLQSDSFPRLSSKAVKLLVDLASQLYYKKDKGSVNNGNLCAAYSLMEPRGWKSKNTLSRARKELETSGFIEVTQKGGRNMPTLYAVTWRAIDEIRSKPWITPTKTPSRKWSSRSPSEQARSPPTFFLLTPKLTSVLPRSAPIAQKMHSVDPKFAPVRSFLIGGVGSILGHLYRSTRLLVASNGRVTGEMVRFTIQSHLPFRRVFSI